jgi:putative flippase GtrA
MKLASRATRFAVAGAIGFVVDAGILIVLVWLGGEPRVVRVLSIAVAITATWYVNRRLTFADRVAAPTWMEYARYVVASLLGAIINYAVFAMLITFGEPFRSYPVLALTIATVVAMAVNFWSYFAVVFRKR